MFAWRALVRRAATPATCTWSSPCAATLRAAAPAAWATPGGGALGALLAPAAARRSCTSSRGAAAPLVSTRALLPGFARVFESTMKRRRKMMNKHKVKKRKRAQRMKAK
ncbi:hypothetical protein JL720_8453 [Aureococcus anophagefferens]|nr:hypothetical protein JL720_8453 [Aureococcus anophagefferens]